MVNRFSLGARAALGVLAGFLMFGAFYLTAASAPYTYRSVGYDAAALRIPAGRRNASAELSFVTLATAQPRGNSIVQGSGWGRTPIAFRTAVIRHGDDVILFNGGPASVSPEPSFPSWNPFGNIETVRTLSSVAEEVGAERVYLPTMHWYSSAGALESESLRIVAPGGEKWGATTGPTPRRFGAEPARWVGFDRFSSLSLRRGGGQFGRRWFDVFGDRSVIVIGLRGSAWDELALLVTTPSGSRYMLVSAAVWTQDQLVHRRPRNLWSSFRLDRNRMQLATTIRSLSRANELGDITVIPIHDGLMRLPEYPATLDGNGEPEQD
jgi:hypothetical protein